MTTNNPQDLQVGDLVKLTGPGWAERRGNEVRISRIDDRGQARFEDERVGAVGDWVADEQPGDDWAVERVLTPAGLRISVNKVIADDNGISIEGRLPEGYTFNDVPQLSVMRGANTRFPDHGDPWAPETKRHSILKTADSLIHGDREQDYGRPIDSFTRVAQAMNVVLEGEGHAPISPTTAAKLMIALKLSRLAGGDNKDDTWIDLAGYAALGAEVFEQEGDL